MATIFDGYNHVGRRTFELIAPQDRITLSIPISQEFDAIHVDWISYKTDTTDLKTLAFRIKNLDCNTEVIQNVAGDQYFDCTLVTYLDTRPDALIFYENNFPPIHITKKGNYTQFDYEIYVNVIPNHSGITISNPVFISISFLKRQD